MAGRYKRMKPTTTGTAGDCEVMVKNPVSAVSLFAQFMVPGLESLPDILNVIRGTEKALTSIDDDAIETDHQESHQKSRQEGRKIKVEPLKRLPRRGRQLAEAPAAAAAPLVPRTIHRWTLSHARIIMATLIFPFFISPYLGASRPFIA